MVFVAFDLLNLNDVDISGLRLDERKSLLEKLLESQTRKSVLRYSEHLVGDAGAMLAEVCKLGLEGIISKRLDKPYRSGRHADWLKIKCVLSDEFVIGGYLDSNVTPKAIGALALGYYAGRSLVYAGRVGTGFDRRTATDLWHVLQADRSKVSPFAKPLDRAQGANVQWLQPRIVAQIDHRAWTADGLLRHASFKGLREDKPAKHVRRPSRA